MFVKTLSLVVLTQATLQVQRQNHINGSNMTAIAGGVIGALALVIAVVVFLRAPG